MRIAVCSDVHANLEALSAVCISLRDEAPDMTVFLGDAVGYGADSDACVNVLQGVADVMLAGNHDHAVCGLCDIEQFNSSAKAALDWTAAHMSRE